MTRNVWSPCLLAVLAVLAACSDALLVPAMPFEVPPLQFTEIDGGEVNTSITVASLIPCATAGLVSVNIEGVLPPSADAPLDVILVIDESDSIDQDKYALVEAAAKSFLETIDQADGLDDNELASTRIGVVKYGRFAVLTQPLSSDYDAILASLSNRSETGITNTYKALETTRLHLQSDARPTALTAVILVTDGKSTGFDPVPEADKLKAAGTEIWAVGVGTGDVGGADLAELNAIASPGNVIEVAAFSQLEAAFELIGGNLTFPAATDIVYSATVPSGFTLVAGSTQTVRGTVSEIGNTVTWHAGRLDSETITMTYQIKHDDIVAPSGGTLTAVTDAMLTLRTPVSGLQFTETLADITTEVGGCIGPPATPDPDEVGGEGGEGGESGEGGEGGETVTCESQSVKKSGKSGKSAKSAASEKSHKSEKSLKSEKSHKHGKSAKSGKSDKSTKSCKSARSS